MKLEVICSKKKISMCREFRLLNPGLSDLACILIHHVDILHCHCVTSAPLRDEETEVC